MKNHHVGILIFLSILIIGLGIWIWQKRGTYNMDPAKTDSDNSAKKPNCSKYLSMGSSGLEVKLLQAWHNENRPFATHQIDVDGIWGPVTESAIQELLGKNQIQLKELDNPPC